VSRKTNLTFRSDVLLAGPHCCARDQPISACGFCFTNYGGCPEMSTAHCLWPLIVRQSRLAHPRSEKSSDHVVWRANGSGTPERVPVADRLAGADGGVYLPHH